MKGTEVWLGFSGLSTWVAVEVAEPLNLLVEALEELTVETG